MDIKVISVEKSPILLGFCYGGIIVNIVCFSVPSWRCKRFWLQRRGLNVVWPVKHSVTLVKEHKREKGKMSVSSFENYFLKGILKRILHSRSAHLHKVEKSRKCQILWAHSSERRVSMQRRNILGKMPDLHEVPIQRGFKGIMCTLVSIKEWVHSTVEYRLLSNVLPNTIRSSELLRAIQRIFGEIIRARMSALLTTHSQWADI